MRYKAFFACGWPFKPDTGPLLSGNGWFDPWTQYPAYLPFAYQAEVLQKGSVAAKPAEKAQEACQKAMDRLGKGKVPVHEDTCEDILNTILDSTVQTYVRMSFWP